MKHFVVTILKHFGVTADSEEAAQAYADDIAAEMSDGTIVWVEEIDLEDDLPPDTQVIH